jgi:hypothetical protein
VEDRHLLQPLTMQGIYEAISGEATWVVTFPADAVKSGSLIHAHHHTQANLPNTPFSFLTFSMS